MTSEEIAGAGIGPAPIRHAAGFGQQFVAQVAVDGLEVEQDLAAAAQQQRADFGRHRAGGRSLEHCHAEPVLDQPDILAEARLRHAERVGGTTDAAVIGDRE